jgi:peptide/nickel transport system ATP-binding protein
MVFQDPYSSLNPRQTVYQMLDAPLKINGVRGAKERQKRIDEMLNRVGLNPDQARLFPHEFSGGQRQRIGLARALILRPRLMICDEPVSALDVSIRAQIINLMLELRRELGLSYIIISHDLSVVEHMCDRVAVMYLGKIVEIGRWDQVFGDPQHPYTKALISAIPTPTEERSALRLEGEIPSPLDPPAGCAFSTRCPSVMERCRQEQPSLKPVRSGQENACFL